MARNLDSRDPFGSRRTSSATVPGGGPGGLGRDPVMEQMRDQFDRDRESFFQDSPTNRRPFPSTDPSSFFNRNPRRSFPAFMNHPGFPDDDFGEDGFGHPPQYHHHPPPQQPSSHSQQQPQDSIPIRVIHERTSNNNNNSNAKKPFVGGRNTTEIPPSSSSNRNSSSPNQGSPRLERSHSEPPKTFTQRLPPRNPYPSPIPENHESGAADNIFTTRLKPEDATNPIKTSASAPSVPSHQNQQQPQQQQPQPQQQPVPPPRRTPPKDNQVRHIPIIVEGRDTPVYSRKMTSSDSPDNSGSGGAGTTFRKPSEYYPPGASVRRNQEHHFQQPQQPQPQQQQQRPSQLNTSSSNQKPQIAGEPTSPLSPPPGPIPMGCSPQHLEPKENTEPTSPQPPPPGPIPMPCSPSLLQKDQKPQFRESSPPKEEQEEKVHKVPITVEKGEEDKKEDSGTAAAAAAADPVLDKVQAIKDEIGKLMERIENFSGSKNDKEYLYLDEMLTRHLLALDGIDTGGREEIRKVRKESIRSVNRCLSLLDSKANPKDADGNNRILSELAEKTAQKESSSSSSSESNNQQQQQRESQQEPTSTTESSLSSASSSSSSAKGKKKKKNEDENEKKKT